MALWHEKQHSTTKAIAFTSLLGTSGSGDPTANVLQLSEGAYCALVPFDPQTGIELHSPPNAMPL